MIIPVVYVGKGGRDCRSSLGPGPGLLKVFLREKDQGESRGRGRSELAEELACKTKTTWETHI